MKRNVRFEYVPWKRGLNFHRLLVTSSLLLVVKSLVTRCKIRYLLVAEVARCKNHSLLVAEVARC